MGRGRAAQESHDVIARGSGTWSTRLNPADPASGRGGRTLPSPTSATRPRLRARVKAVPALTPPAAAHAAVRDSRGHDATLVQQSSATLPRDARTDFSTQPEPAVGQKLKNRYLLDERIGEGGMGIVFSATDLEAVRLGNSSSKVAIKVLAPGLRSHEAALFDEVQKTRQLQQQNIVDVYGFEPDEAGSFMVMELLSGLPLDRFVATSWPHGIPLPVALPCIEGMAAALSYAHQRGVIHSDFKPSNVFITGAGVKVLDFGIARAAREAEPGSPRRQKLIGVTPDFASCEMLEDLPADRRDDVFCFGLVVYFLLTARHPFNGFPATQARDLGLPVLPIPHLDKRQNATLQRALSFDRNERSESIEEVVKGLSERRPAHALVRLALGLAAVLAAAALGYFYRDTSLAPRDSDRQFVRMLCHRTSGAPPLSAQDRQLMDTLLEQGNSYLHAGQDSFDPGALSENDASALRAFRSALALAPQDCDAAAEGVLKVAKAYKDEAWRLYAEGRYRKAAQTAAIALRIWSGSSEMRELMRKTARYLPADSHQAP